MSKVSLVVPEPHHAAELARFMSRNRKHFASGEPARMDSYYTEEGQRDAISSWARERTNDTRYLWIIRLGDEIAGRISLNSVVRGALQSASVGFLVGKEFGGRGIATEALRQTIAFAFRDIDLHRIQAEALLDNAPSQAVLERCGFEQYGIAEDYLRIDGQWQTHVLFQLINPRHSSLTR